MPIERHDHRPLLARILQLRDRLSAYDAAYVALADTLEAPLATVDAGLAKVARELGVEVLAFLGWPARGCRSARQGDIANMRGALVRRKN